jgi:hypothetical protein
VATRVLWVFVLYRTLAVGYGFAMLRSMKKRVTNHKTAAGGPPEVFAR